jgi:hypothetical protein
VDRATLLDFHAKIKPLGRGWDAVTTRTRGAGLDALDAGDSDRSESDSTGEFAAGLLSWFLGCVMVYAALFGTGFLLYGNVAFGVVGLVIAAMAGRGVLKLLPKVGFLT